MRTSGATFKPENPNRQAQGPDLHFNKLLPGFLRHAESADYIGVLFQVAPSSWCDFRDAEMRPRVNLPARKQPGELSSWVEKGRGPL